MRANPLAIFISTYFFLFLKFPQFMTLFWFTPNEGDVALAFYVFGSLVGAQNLSFFVLKYAYKNYFAFQAAMVTLFVIVMIIIDCTAYMSSIEIMATFTFLAGLFLSTIICQEIW
jgi:hypothetical protein